ncbi:helix-turn-helix transcriptional regulator [Leucobacter tenebrionis]|uniref:helix-turn-helix transcriptional regulator n=1 Tax=Leucobacter tenebrionis TaxID=2873270 RepID=UPI001CA6793F|nr:WYL domain-containing protein [Leucobacter tenebrionis]QZY50885.1 WYL domain-containing protein [Leucobacter tenebrionis]
MERPQRLLALLVALQANRQMTAAELAEQFGVSRRTILRDVEALAEAEIPIIAERGRYGGVALLPGAEVDVNRLSGNEAEVLELIGVDLTRAKQLGIEAAARTAAQKLASRRPWPHGDPAGLLPLSEVVAIDNAAWFTPGDSADVAAVIRDVRRGKRLRINYRASGRPDSRERVVDPYGVFSRGGRWYLIADAGGEPRMFALSRLQAWAVLDEDRRIRTDLALADIAASLVSGLEERHSIRVTALLDAKTEDMARRILGTRLLSVEPTEHPAEVRITVGYDQLAAVRQLLQFADHVEITDPPEARALIADLATTLASRHRDAGVAGSGETADG